MKQIRQIIVFFIIVSFPLLNCQKKPIQIEVYPSEIEEDNSIMANENVLISLN